MTVDLNDFELQWIRQTVSSAMSSLATINNARVARGRKPEQRYVQRLAQLKLLSNKLQGGPDL